MEKIDVIDYEFVEKYGDPRISSYLLMDTPIHTIALTTAYCAATFLGIFLMKNKQSCDLKVPFFLYNMAVVLLSVWMFIKLGIHGWFTKYSWNCEPLNLSNDPDTLEIVKVCWVFYVSRLIEFVDTIFLVLKKNSSTLNHFHILHRWVIPLTAWYFVKYCPGGYNTFPMMADLFVRSLIYFYYGFAAIVPSIQKHSFMKTSISLLQMVQFISVIAYMSHLYLFATPDCRVSQFLLSLSFTQSVFGLSVSLFVFFSSTRKNATKGIEKYKKLK
ncbi:hypothetical protein JTE90_002168 [Oedothorax gibbosus]|uniref:Elongation of very long chain fatty acids protein n=1 Tax=Oedothorax gibbosus TaxID=931172 RepID=A0AAV6V9D7_9ARAC|nr:hypothetical protein JTE90_002168 [Oedothorax gibbosus]